MKHFPKKSAILRANPRFCHAAVILMLAGWASGLAPAAEIATVAGTGEQAFGGDGGSATEAKLDNPFGLVVGPEGDLYFCDTGNHCVRKISRKTGTITTVAGTGGKQGYAGDGGPATEALCFEPYEVRFHRNGDLYWVEMRNNLVRRLDARSGKVFTVAGTGQAGFSGDGGAATEAQLKQPHSIQFDASFAGLYICDIGNHRIRRVDLASGKIETWCGSGKAEATPDGAKVSPETPLKGPRALDIAPNGDFWLALREGNQIFRIDMKAGTLHHVAGSGAKGFDAASGPATDAKLSGPKGVAVSPDGKLIYLADTESHSIRAIDLRNDPPTLELIAGTGKKGNGPDGPDPLKCQMARPHGVGIDPVTGDLYIGDSESHEVRRVTGLPGGKPQAAAGAVKEDFEFGGRKAILLKPAQAAPGNPWIWRCRFFGAFPQADNDLVARGWHVAWIDVAHLFGGPESMEAFDGFYDHLTKERGLAPKVVMEGFSRGGLPAVNWAIRHPDRVSAVYIDAPVLDIHSWPKPSSADLWRKAMAAYSLTEATADSWKGPLDRLEPLAKAKVPILSVCGGADAVVPFAENSAILEERYRALGGEIEVVVKATCDHHPHSLYDPARIVAWVLENANR
ncbi:MAG: SMP-30/gluconolactonase/LRE family protein [Akkermansiaceae bacterium]|nr:SMP-30/gluconolactonase/LRE family protein [Akkermansiaceae bacterium]